MRTPQIKSFKRIIPMIYAYTTPEIPSHRGWTKIGYTANQTVEERIHQQTHTADVTPDILWRGSARYQDGTDEPFTDHEFHDYLTTKRHVERKPQTEWFHIDGETSHHYFHQFASDQIYNWSYADEQQAKADWNEDQNGSSNPYAVMPRLNMYTYQLSSMMVKQGSIISYNS